MFHAHVHEYVCMKLDLATAEEFEMEGREHKNKIFSRFIKSKYDGVVETKQKGTRKIISVSK